MADGTHSATTLSPHIFEGLEWLVAGMTTWTWAMRVPSETRPAMAMRLRDELGLRDARIVLAEQVHGCGVGEMNNQTTRRPEQCERGETLLGVREPCSRFHPGKPCFPSLSASVAGGGEGASMACAVQGSRTPPRGAVGDAPRGNAGCASSGIVEIRGVDALVTNEAHALIGVFTADCVPVALVDPRARNLAVVHAGREGTRQRIVRKAVDRLCELGSSPRDLLAWVGPSVCAAHYEVSVEIAAEFRNLFGSEAGVVCGPEGRHLDLKAINRFQLIECGVESARIETDPRCTFEDAERFFSYRREGASAGRMFTFLAMRESN
jgi:YfiH family protein